MCCGNKAHHSFGIPLSSFSLASFISHCFLQEGSSASKSVHCSAFVLFYFCICLLKLFLHLGPPLLISVYFNPIQHPMLKSKTHFIVPVPWRAQSVPGSHFLLWTPTVHSQDHLLGLYQILLGVMCCLSWKASAMLQNPKSHHSASIMKD